MKRRSWILAALLGSSLTMAGIACDNDGATESGGSGLTVGFSQVGAESAWRTANTRDIKETAEDRGIDLRFSDAQQKQDNQIKAIQNFISQGVDVIAFAPVVKTGWDPVLREAQAAGIPVVLTDRRIDTSDESLYACFVGGNFVQEGRLAGEFLVEATDGEAVIVELEGTPGADPAIQRKQGFHEVIAEYPDMRVIKEQTGDFTRSRGREVMEAFLNSAEGNQITALFAHNDDMALGAIQAIEAAGKKPGEDIAIVSIDAVKGAFEAMQEGKLNATVECSPLLGDAIFDAIEKVASGEAVEKQVVVEPQIFTPDQAEELLPTRKY